MSLPNLLILIGWCCVVAGYIGLVLFGAILVIVGVAFWVVPGRLRRRSRRSYPYGKSGR
jgi:drug/metabolite transporter (DMT)-like permease